MTVAPPTKSPITSVVVVTGLSGAGKSTAVNALEDLGYFCVDSLPTPVLPATLAAFAAAGVHRVAFGIDVRVRRFLDGAAKVLQQLESPGERELTVPMPGNLIVLAVASGMVAVGGAMAGLRVLSRRVA